MKIYFVSLGCDKNRVDSEEMLGLLEASGFSFCNDEREADVIVINTCCFIDSAKEESIETILEMARMKSEGVCRRLVVTGCMAERYREEIAGDLPEVDAVVGVNELFEIIAAVEPDRKREETGHALQGIGTHLTERGTESPESEETGFAQRGIGADKEDPAARCGKLSAESEGTAARGGQKDGNPGGAGESPAARAGKPAPRDRDPSARGEKPARPKRVITTPGHYEFLKIADGCDKKCTYCIIPYIRGSYRSVEMEDVLSDAHFLADRGVKELIVVAQETTLYGTDIYGKRALPELLTKLCAVDGVRWIRLMYAYPEDISDELLKVMASQEKIVKYLDVPVQHSSDSVLKRMGRRTTRADIENTIARIRSFMPDVCLRTSLIAGFPGESEDDHKDLLDFVEKTRFDRLGVFAYSREEGTGAARLSGQISPRVKERRRREIMELQEKISLGKMSGMKGKSFDVFIEGFLPDDDVYVGRTYMDAPDVDGYFYLHSDRRLETGDFIRAVCTDSGSYDLYGEAIRE